MNNMLLKETESLCPVCLTRIPARRVVKDGNVYLEKECSEHGYFNVLLWRGADSYLNWAVGSSRAHPVRPNAADILNKGCPFDCGLCSQHEGGTCTAVLELTYRCDMECPICFAESGGKNRFKADMQTINKMYQAVLEQNGAPCSVQLSGGEPTLRDDLPEIIRRGKELGFTHIQVNTNGLRIASDIAYLEKLKESGADLIYLQFDGLSDSVYEVIRGRKLLETKIKALENCRKCGIGVLLVPTIVPNVNDCQIGEIVRFAKEWMPVVRGIHFQPVSYFGRYPLSSPADENRFTLPDLIESLVNQTDGELKADAFVPRRRKDSHCGFSSLFVLGKDGKLVSLTEKPGEVESLTKEPEDSGLEYFSARVNRFTNRFWRLSQGNEKFQELEERWERFIEVTLRYTLSITAMAFQDVWNIDVERLRGCCVHVVMGNGKLVPLCAFHVTAINGKRLYENK